MIGKKGWVCEIGNMIQIVSKQFPKSFLVEGVFKAIFLFVLF